MSEIAEPIAAEAAPALTADQRVDAAITGLMSKNVATPTARNPTAGTIPYQDCRIFSTHVELEVKGMKKSISLLDFKQTIDNQLQLESRMDTMQLPFGTYLMAKSANAMQMSVYYPERKLDLKHMSGRDSKAKEYKGCAVPNVVIAFDLRFENKFWVVAQAKYFATNKKVTELPETPLTQQDARSGVWAMPFPNFYDHGGMCYGGNTMPTRHANNLRGLDYFYDIISVSPFNNDLGLPGVPDYSGDIEGWFKYLQTLEKFDYTKLRYYR